MFDSYLSSYLQGGIFSQLFHEVEYPTKHSYICVCMCLPADVYTQIKVLNPYLVYIYIYEIISNPLTEFF